MIHRWLIAAAMVTLVTPATWAGHYGKLDWMTGDPDKNMQKAQSLGKPMALFFTADW